MAKRIFAQVSILALLASLPGAAVAGEAPPSAGSLLRAVDSAHLELPAGEPMALEKALALTYESNPEIEAARAQLRGLDETYAQAASGFRPSVSGNASWQEGALRGDATGRTKDSPRSVSVEVVQSLYSGGGTQDSMTAAGHRIRSQRSGLRATEQRVLLRAIGAYVDVRHDQEVVMLTVNNETVLAGALRAAQERMRLGAITVTDVRQAETRLSAATARRIAAGASYHKSRALFQEIVGVPAGDLLGFDAGITPPESLDAAVQRAQENSPDISAARLAMRAALADTDVVRDEKLPQLSLIGQAGRTYDPTDSLDDRVDSGSVVLRATMPFYTGGRSDSRIRQSLHAERQRQMELRKADRDVRQSVTEAWENLSAATAEAEARKVQIASAKTSRDGVKAEADYGTRTTLDILDAEREYLDAQVAYADAERDRIVSLYSLLAAMGELSPEALHIGAAYNPAAHFERVKNKWGGTSTQDN